MRVTQHCLKGVLCKAFCFFAFCKAFCVRCYPYHCLILEIKCSIIKPGNKVMHVGGINCLKNLTKYHEVCRLGCPSGYKMLGNYSSFGCTKGDRKAIAKWQPDPKLEENKPRCKGQLAYYIIYPCSKCYCSFAQYYHFRL